MTKPRWINSPCIVCAFLHKLASARAPHVCEYIFVLCVQSAWAAHITIICVSLGATESVIIQFTCYFNGMEMGYAHEHLYIMCEVHSETTQGVHIQLKLPHKHTCTSKNNIQHFYVFNAFPCHSIKYIFSLYSRLSARGFQQGFLAIFSIFAMQSYWLFDSYMEDWFVINAYSSTKLQSLCHHLNQCLIFQKVIVKVGHIVPSVTKNA